MTRPTEAFVSGNLFELGLGHVVLNRFRGATAELGVFLVDVYCQGVKDAFYNFLVLANEAQNRELERAGFEIRQKIAAPPTEPLVPQVS